jgi:hypothetical protein
LLLACIATESSMRRTLAAIAQSLPGHAAVQAFGSNARASSVFAKDFRSPIAGRVFVTSILHAGPKKVGLYGRTGAGPLFGVLPVGIAEDAALFSDAGLRGGVSRLPTLYSGGYDCGSIWP